MRTNFCMRAVMSMGMALLACTAALAQTYPTRPITWVNPSSAGGPTDSLGRMVSDQIAQILGQSILTENIAGAGGTIGAAKVARATPDGYTFLVGHVGYMAAAVSLYRQLPYDPAKDFDTVFRLPDMPGILVVNPNAPFKTLPALIAYARSNPGKINFGDGGVGTMSNLVVSMFAGRAGIEVAQISHKGNAPALVAVLAGHVDGMIEPPNTAMPHVSSGKAIALAVTSRQPLDYLPGVPPIADLYPGFDGTVWFGIYAPKGTPRPVIERMHRAYLQVMSNPAFTRRMTDAGLQLLTDAQYAPAAFQEHAEAEIKKYRGVIRDAKIPPQ